VNATLEPSAKPSSKPLAEPAPGAPVPVPVPAAVSPRAPFHIELPANTTQQTAQKTAQITAQSPLIYASPHSGDYYPPDFVAASRLSDLSLRMAEDSFIDRLFAAAPAHGAPLLRATYARVYVDPNREPYELDPAMFDERLPAHANTTSPRVAGGLGTIPRIVSRGAEIYLSKLQFSEVEQRLRAIYFPYHQALKRLINQSVTEFGGCLLVDCHSMPSQGGPLDRNSEFARADIVLGDRYSASCRPAITELAVETLRKAGFSVVRNVPYAGGFTTANYGQPASGVQALQIELNRGLYMDETRIVPLPCFNEISERLAQFIKVFADLDPAVLTTTD
jgi:N-formylglutamate amidohydrolase